MLKVVRCFSTELVDFLSCICNLTRIEKVHVLLIRRLFAMIVRCCFLKCALALVVRSLFVKLMSINATHHDVLNLKCFFKVTQIRPNAFILRHCTKMYWCSVRCILCKASQNEL